jgi:hypothetical protein
VGAHAQAQVEAVILHTLFTTLTISSQVFFFGSLPTHANTNIKMVWPNPGFKLSRNLHKCWYLACGTLEAWSCQSLGSA